MGSEAGKAEAAVARADRSGDRLNEERNSFASKSAFDEYVAMDAILWLELLALFGLLGLSAFFSSSETSLFSLDRMQLAQMKRENNPRVGLIERLLSEPRRLIVTILIGNELVNVSASVLSAGVIIGLFGAELKWINIFVMVPILLLFGEITPKSLAIRRNVSFATFQCVFIERFAQIIAPVRWTVRRVSDIFITMLVGEERTAASIITEDMVRTLTNEAVGHGAIDDREATYIHRIFDFGDRLVRDIATPRSQIFMLPVSMPLEEIAAELHRTRHTKVPVYEDGDKDTILGILFARDLLGLSLLGRRGEDDRETLIALLRRANFVPESRPADSLFFSFRQRRLSLALTVDEFGGVTGLLTMEDLLECIFGDIDSRSEQLRRELNGFEDLGDGRYRIHALMTIKQFNELLGRNLVDDSAETVGGLLLERFGEVPEEGSTTEIDGIGFTVVSVSGHRMGQIIADISAGVSPPSPAAALAGPPPEDAPENASKADNGSDQDGTAPER